MTTVFDKTIQCVVDLNPEDHRTLKSAALRHDMTLKAIIADACHIAARRYRRLEMEEKRREVFQSFVTETSRKRHLDGRFRERPDHAVE